jgi:hypothetical protein
MTLIIAKEPNSNASFRIILIYLSTTILQSYSPEANQIITIKTQSIKANANAIFSWHLNRLG